MRAGGFWAGPVYRASLVALFARQLAPGHACLYVWSLPLPDSWPWLCVLVGQVSLFAGHLTPRLAYLWAWPLLQDAGTWPSLGRPRVWTSGVGSQAAACHPPGRRRAHAWARPFKLHCFLNFGGVVALAFFFPWPVIPRPTGVLLLPCLPDALES